MAQYRYSIFPATLAAGSNLNINQILSYGVRSGSNLTDIIPGWRLILDPRASDPEDMRFLGRPVVG